MGEKKGKQIFKKIIEWIDKDKGKHTEMNIGLGLNKLFNRKGKKERNKAERKKDRLTKVRGERRKGRKQRRIHALQMAYNGYIGPFYLIVSNK